MSSKMTSPHLLYIIYIILCANCAVKSFMYKVENENNKILSRILNNEAETNVTSKELLLSNENIEILRELGEAMYNLRNRNVLILLEDTEEVHQEAEMLLKGLLKLVYREKDFGLMKFNSTGVTPVLANSLASEDFFLQLLGYRENKSELETSTILGINTTEQGVVAFFAVLKAIRTLPDNSGIIIFASRRIDDEDLAQLAIKELLAKRIRLYVVWVTSFPNPRLEEKLLKDVAILTGGNFFVVKTKRNLSASYSGMYYKNPDATKAKALVAFYNHITGSKRLSFPINADVKSIHISLTSTATAVNLISPRGYTVNLLDNTDVERFSIGSFAISETKLGRYEIQLNTVGKLPTSIAGIWHLDVDVGTQQCDITISVQTHLNVTAYVAETYVSIATNQAELPRIKKILRVSISGDLGNVNNITLLNEKGIPINGNVEFHSEKITNKEPLENQPETQRELDIELNSLPKEPFYLQISGQDGQGTTFSRLSYFDREKINYVFQSLTVEVGAGSELLVAPNQQAKVYFEVTNNRDQVMYVYFQVQDERSLLARMEPRSSWLNPKQTVIVTVTTYIPNTAGTNFRDLITFTVSGPERVQKSAAMYIGTNRVVDNEEPRLTHRYTSDCTNILLGDCQGGTWVIEVTAEDRESGLLQLTSSPKGLYFPNSYVAGTKEPVVGLYGGSCCQSKIQLTAIDMQNNRRTYTADAYFATLSAGSIAAIVLGLILFIAIVVVIIILCRVKCCKKKESVDLPTYRSPHGNTESRY